MNAHKQLHDNTLWTGLLFLSRSLSGRSLWPCLKKFFWIFLPDFSFWISTILGSIPNVVKSHSFSHLSRLLLVAWINDGDDDDNYAL